MKIGVVGSGLVGSTAAYALLMRGIGNDIILIDINEARAQAEASDLMHAVPFAHPMQIRSGGYGDLAGSRVVILTAGVNQQPGETRLELLERNASIFRGIVPQVLEHAPEAVLLVATNPVDVLTHMASLVAEDHGVPSTRVLGSGTTLDTARLRSLLGRRLGVDPHHVHAYVVGEHGESEVIPWSLVTIGGMTLEDYCREHRVDCGPAEWDQMEEQVCRAAYEIIEGKGATYYGIGSALARIVAAIVNDQRAILTVSTRAGEVVGVADVTVSLPRLVGGQGVMTTFPLQLEERERGRLAASARVVRGALDALTGEP